MMARTCNPIMVSMLPALLLLATPASPLWAQQTLANGGFEKGTAAWWGGGLKGGGAVGDEPGEGGKCLKILGDYVCQDKIPITAGQRYRISMQIRSDAAPEGSIYVQLSYRGNGLEPGWYGPAKAKVDERAEPALYSTGGTHSWKPFSVVVRAPDGANQMLLYLRKWNGSTGAAYFDDVRVEPTDTPETAETLEPERVGNLIVNGDFASGNNAWWGDGLKDSRVTTGSAGEPARSLSLSSKYLCQDKLPVRGGSRYRISMKIRGTDAPEGSIYVQASFRGPGVDAGWYGPALAKVSGRTEKALFTAGGSPEWKEFSVVLAAPPKANQALLYLRKADGTAGTANFADIRMEKTDEPATTAGELRRRELARELLLPPSPDAAALLQKARDAAKEPAAKSLLLAQDGVARYHVHVATAADVRVLAAGRDLAAYLGQITGGDFAPLSHDGHPQAGPLLVLGRDSELAASLTSDVAWNELGTDGFVIRTRGPHVVIAGATPGGTMYGVYWFLDHKLGVKWLSPDYTHVPATRTLALSLVNETQKPRFAFRQILSYEGQNKPFAAHNLLNGNSHGAYGVLPSPEIDHWENSWQRPGLTGSFYELLPTKQHQAAHPDWYAGGQVAMMNPAARQALADAIVKRLQGVSDYQNYWFGLMDNDWGWDMDPASAAFAKQHGNVPSAPLTDLQTDVLSRVRQVLPQAKIAFNAYHWGFTPPTGLAIPDGLRVFPMTIHLDYSTPLFAGRNEQLGRDIAGWNAIAKDILLWDHITNFNGYIQPTPNLYPICETLHWLADFPNIHGYFAEGSWNTKNAEFSSLRVWLMGRMLWDPATDYRAAMAEYCNAYFGPAGPAVLAYIQLMHEASAKSKAPIWEKTNVDSAMLTLDFVAKADALFEQAEAAAANSPVYLKHVRQARVCVDYVILIRRKEYQEQAAQRGVTFALDWDRRLSRFQQTVKDEGIKEYRQGGTMEELAGILAIERRTSTPPEIAKDLPAKNWAEVQDLGINRYYRPTVLVADPLASDGAAAREDGNGEAWLIQLKHHSLPAEGLWEIYAEVRVEAGEMAPDATALCVGSAPPMGNFVKVPFSQVADGKYHLIKAPGGPFRYTNDDQKCTYVKGANSKTVKYIYVDRFVFVRAPETSKK